MNSAQEEWVTAMKEEMDAFVENDTWEFVDCPKNVKVIDNRWVLRMKLNAGGLTQRLRSRLVVKGLIRKVDIHYYEIFNPVACYETVRAVLTVATLERLQLHQLDMKTAFLYDTLQEKVYMRQRGSTMAAAGCASSSEACTVSSKPLGVGINGL